MDTVITDAAVEIKKEPLPERCRESWRLSEELRRRGERLREEDPSMTAEEYHHIAEEMCTHHLICPQCKRWWRSFDR